MKTVKAWFLPLRVYKSLLLLRPSFAQIYLNRTLEMRTYYFSTGVVNFRVFKAPPFIPYSEGLSYWNLWPWHAPEIRTVPELFWTAAGAQLTDAQSCTCHLPPSLLISPAQSPLLHVDESFQGWWFFRKQILILQATIHYPPEDNPPPDKIYVWVEEK